MDSRKKLHAYWKRPSLENRFTKYMGGVQQNKRSKFLAELIKCYVEPAPLTTVLELGCNVGRNLKFLRKNGYKNLTGVDINKAACGIAAGTVPGSTIVCDSIEHFSKVTKEQFSVVFTMAVLMHVRNSEINLFANIAKLSKDYLITLESEILKVNKRRNIGRNYEDIFEAYGFYQVEEIHPVPGMINAYTGRVFIRRS